MISHINMRDHHSGDPSEILTAEKCNSGHHSHHFIRVDLPVHGQREPEQAAWVSVFPDGVTGVKVKGENRSWEQKIRKQVKSSEVPPVH